MPGILRPVSSFGGSRVGQTMNKQLFHLIPYILFSTIAFAAHPKFSPDLENVDLNSDADVIVQFTSTPGPAHHEKIRSRGGRLKTELGLIKSSAYSIPAYMLDDLASDPEVAHISLDRKVGGSLDSVTAAVNAASAWNSSLTGSGIGVAVIDSGITDSADLPVGRIVYKQDWINNDWHDYYGHGSHVAGIIGGSGSRSHCSSCVRNLQGIAPGVNFIDLRVLDQNGAGTDSNVIAAINKAISLKSTYNIRVINLSLGRPVYESYTKDPLCQAVEAAWKAGIVVVVAAGNNGRDNSQGNSGYGTITAPGNDPYVITVGAMRTMGTPSRSDDLVASYSSKGPTVIDHIVKPDIVAPGNQVVSLYSSTGTLYSNYPGNMVPMDYFMSGAGSGASNLYYRLSGTSMATPVVSGAVALLLQAKPLLTPDQVKAKLMVSAYKKFPASSIATDPTTGQTFTSQYDIFTIGAGYLDIAALLADTTSFSGSAVSPTATFNSSSSTTAVVCSSNSICATLPVSGSKSLWGSTSLWGSKTLWGSTSLWGSKSVWGSSSTDAVESTSITLNGEN